MATRSKESVLSSFSSFRREGWTFSDGEYRFESEQDGISACVKLVETDVREYSVQASVKWDNTEDTRFFDSSDVGELLAVSWCSGVATGLIWRGSDAG